MAEYVNGTPCTHKLCKKCDNNCGGVCAYDLQMEAEERGLKVSDLINDETCKFYDYCGGEG